MSAAATTRPRILVVDDSPGVLSVLARRLASWAYEPLIASSGEEGLQICETKRPDLVLLDIMMPKMKGREVCAQLKANPKTQDIPVIFLTALGLPDFIKAGMDMGAEDYIVKPFEPKTLKERIAVVLARHRDSSRGT